MEADSGSSSKLRGAYFTPPVIAEFLASWAIHSLSDRILEPSCGEASFLLAAASERMKLNGSVIGDLVGVELHNASAIAARSRLQQCGIDAQINVADFFDFSTGAPFDVVLGNPPFIRYQTFAGEGRLKGIAAALRQGVRLSKMASAWAAFLIHACGFLKPEGRLGLVLPAELLSVNYASTVRAYLMSRFASLKIITFEQQIFPGVQEEVVLLLASGIGTSDKFDLLQARNLGDLEGSLGRRWSFFRPERIDEKWTHAFIPEEALSVYRAYEIKKTFEPMRAWGKAYLGCVTGANDFFLMSEADVRSRGLEDKDLIPILPPGSRHLRGIELSKAAWAHLRDEGERVHLFSPLSHAMSAPSEKHISDGETDGIDHRYKCRVRKPWWRVPLVDKPDLFVSYMTQDGVRLVSNRAGLHVTNSHYGFKFARGRKTIGQSLLPIAALNSLTLLGSEMEGRAYGGGLLKIEPREVERLPLPSLSTVAEAASDLEAVLPQVAAHLRRGKLGVVCEPIDDILLRNGMGLSQAEVRDVRGARKSLLERRMVRNKRLK